MLKTLEIKKNIKVSYDITEDNNILLSYIGIDQLEKSVSIPVTPELLLFFNALIDDLKVKLYSILNFGPAGRGQPLLDNPHDISAKLSTIEIEQLILELFRGKKVIRSVIFKELQERGWKNINEEVFTASLLRLQDKGELKIEERVSKVGRKYQLLIFTDE